jgi:hypothetical protein
MDIYDVYLGGDLGMMARTKVGRWWSPHWDSEVHLAGKYRYLPSR